MPGPQNRERQARSRGGTQGVRVRSYHIKPLALCALPPQSSRRHPPTQPPRRAPSGGRRAAAERGRTEPRWFTHIASAALLGLNRFGIVRRAQLLRRVPAPNPRRLRHRVLPRPGRIAPHRVPAWAHQTPGGRGTASESQTRITPSQNMVRGEQGACTPFLKLGGDAFQGGARFSLAPNCRARPGPTAARARCFCATVRASSCATCASWAARCGATSWRGWRGAWCGSSAARAASRARRCEARH